MVLFDIDQYGAATIVYMYLASLILCSSRWSLPFVLLQST